MRARSTATTEDFRGRARRVTLLIFVLGFYLLPMQGYQSASNKTPAELPLSVSIVDSHGAVIPRVDIDVLSNNRIIAHAQTGEDGRTTLEVGRGVFVVSIHQPGFTPIHQVVDLRSASELAIHLDPIPQAQETVNVQANSEEITTQTSSPGTSIKPAEAKESPLRPLTLTDVLPLVPGVVVGPNGQTQIAGAGEMHSALIVNSVDAVDPATGRFGLSVPIDVIDSLHVLTSPYLAQYGRFTAGVVAAETKPGGDKWHYDLNDPLPEFRIRSGHLVGLKSATPRLSFGGPIVPDRASFSEGMEFVDNKVEIRTLPFPFNETKTMSFNSFTQADFTLTPHQTLTTSFHTAPENLRYANLDFFNPQAVTPNRDTRPYTGIVTHRFAMGDTLLESTFSLANLNTSVTSQGPLGMTVFPTGSSGNYFADQQRHSRRLEWNELWSLRPVQGWGLHKIQIGSSFADATDQGRFNARTITLCDAQSVKIRTIEFTGGSPFDRNDKQPAIFIQDHWSINSRLALDAGMRAESQTITATTRYAPRVGFIWNPSRSEGTTVTGGVGTFYDSVPLNIYAFSNYPEQVVTNYLPNGAVSGAPTTYLNLTSQAATSDYPFIDRDRKIGDFAPYTLAWNLQVERRISNQLALRAKYLESYGHALVTLSPQVVQGQNAYVLAGNGSAKYQQFELTAKVSLQPQSPIYISYVHSFSRGSLNEADNYLGDFPSPFIQSGLYGNRLGDIPNRLLAWGSVALPWKFTVYPRIEWRSGFPWQSFDVYQNYIAAEKTEITRFPSYFDLDMRIAKDVKLNSRYTLRPSISLTNVTNHFNALEVHSNTEDPQYGHFFGNYNFHGRFDLDLIF